MQSNILTGIGLVLLATFCATNTADCGCDTNEDIEYENECPLWPKSDCSNVEPRQSPVNINIQRTIKKPLPLLELDVNLSLLLGSINITNNGHTVSITFAEKVKIPILRGGPLKNKYSMVELHLHWGEDNYKGSEHSINCYYFSQEVHVVFLNEKYEDLDTAKRNEDGIAVTAFFGAVGPYENEKLNPLLNKIEAIEYAGRSIEGTVGIDLNFLTSILNSPHQNYFTYPGSLTTGGYEECVTWIVFTQPFYMSPCQGNKFKKIRSEEGTNITANKRKLQDLNKRPIIQPTNRKLFKLNSFLF